MNSLAKCSRCGVYSVHPAGPNWCLSCRSTNSVSLSSDGRFLQCWHNGSIVRNVYLGSSSLVEALASCQEYLMQTIDRPAVLERSLRSLGEGDKVLVEGVVSAVTRKGIVVRCKDVDFEGATVHAPAWAVSLKVAR